MTKTQVEKKIRETQQKIKELRLTWKVLYAQEVELLEKLKASGENIPNERVLAIRLTLIHVLSSQLAAEKELEKLEEIEAEIAMQREHRKLTLKDLCSDPFAPVEDPAPNSYDWTKQTRGGK